MCARSAGSLSALAAALRRARRLLVTTHVRADGDALGSMLALHAAAGLAGKDSQMVLPEPVPRRYRFLFAGGAPICLSELPQGPAAFARLADRADAIVVVDTCSFEQLAPMAGALKERRGKVAVIDHHATADDVGALVWRDESAAAAGVMVAQLLKRLSWPAEPPVPEALATAICTDTGWLRHPNTDARVLRILAGLAAGGLRLDALYARIYQADRPQRVRLLAAALASLSLHADDRLAVMTLTAPDFDRAGAGRDETEDFVNEPLRIATVEVSALVVEQGEGAVRVSLRSRGRVDVAALAGRFGGGGHARAAGFRAAGDLESVRRRLLEACLAALR